MAELIPDADAEVPDEVQQQAHAELSRAVARYYAIVDPPAYVDAWVLVTHRRRPALEQAGLSTVGVITADGQAFPMTSGLLHEALDAGR